MERRASDLLAVTALVAALSLVALALRLYRLEFQSLWWDEGVSLYLATLDPSALIVGKDFQVDLHPPLYHLLLSVWTRLAGTTAFSARYLSVLAGVGCLPLAYDLGRRTFGRSAGLVAALLTSLSAFAVFYSQESRMYTWVPLFGLLSMVLFLRALDQPTHLRWLALGAVNALCLYLYYYLAFLVATEFIVLVVVAARRPVGAVGRPLPVTAGMGTMVATGLAFLPWAVYAAVSLMGGTAAAIPAERVVDRTPGGFLSELLLTYTGGFDRPATLGALAAACCLALAVVGLASKPRDRVAWWTVTLGIALPVALAFTVNLGRPFFFPRFIGWAQPLIFVLLGGGVTALAGWTVRRGRGAARIAAGVGAAGAIAMVLLCCYVNIQSLRAQYATPRTAYSTADYRVTLATIARYARPGDVVIGTYPWQVGYAAAYLPGSAHDLRYVRDASALAAQPDLARPDRRVWTLLYSPDRTWGPNDIESALDRRGPTALTDQFGDSRVRLFGSSNEVSDRPVARLGAVAGLLAYEQSPVSGIRRGGRVSLALVWQALTKGTSTYTVFTHLIGPDGRVWGQLDAQPLGGLRPTSAWSPGEIVIDRYGLMLAADAPPGEYYTEVGMYDPATGQRLPVGRSAEETDRVIIARFKVVE